MGVFVVDLWRGEQEGEEEGHGGNLRVGESSEVKMQS